MMHELAAFASAVASRALSEKILTILQIAELHQLVLHQVAKIIFLLDDAASVKAVSFSCMNVLWVLSLRTQCPKFIIKSLTSKSLQTLEAVQSWPLMTLTLTYAFH